MFISKILLDNKIVNCSQFNYLSLLMNLYDKLYVNYIDRFVKEYVFFVHVINL